MGVLLNINSTEGQEETGQLLVLAVQSGVLASVKRLLEGGCTEGRAAAAALDAAQKLAKHEMVDVLLKYQSCLVPDLSDPREGSDQGVGKGDAVSGDATPRDAYPSGVS